MQMPEKRSTRARGTLVHIPVSGHYHQGNPSLFHHDSVGRQCVANSVSAITRSCVKDIDTWAPGDMDNILGCGDALYQTIERQHNLLEVKDIPSLYSMFGRDWVFREVYEEHSAMSSDTIARCLHNSMQYGTYAVLMNGDEHGSYATGLVHRNGSYYLFDPHSRSFASGMPESDGHCIVAKFQDISSLASYVYKVGQITSAKEFSVSVIDVLARTGSNSAGSSGHQSGPVIDSSPPPCPLCGMKCHNFTNYFSHRLVCTGKSKRSKITPQTHGVKNETSKKRTKPNPLYQCSVCQKTVDSEFNLKQHEVSCKKKHQKYYCSVCNRELTSKHNLTEHEKACKRKHQKFLCKICGKELRSEHNLKEHKKACRKNPMTKEQTNVTPEKNMDTVNPNTNEKLSKSQRKNVRRRANPEYYELEKTKNRKFKRNTGDTKHKRRNFGSRRKKIKQQSNKCSSKHEEDRWKYRFNQVLGGA